MINYIVACLQKAWLHHRLRNLKSRSGRRFSDMSDVMMLRAMIGTKAEHQAVDMAARLVHETLEDPRFNGPWRSDQRPIAREIIRGMFETTFPATFVSQVFELVDLMEPAR
ncbi:MAG: hypothetical protein IE912_10955 [Brevundimonas diminuta]|nr:hypothetical protein [Brevundimonas diminuta]MBD3819398.1 hypothetical protein [Brevundimonas diminuta]